MQLDPGCLAISLPHAQRLPEIMAPVAGPSTRKRTAKQRDSEDATKPIKAPLESFGQLELAQENGEDGSVDEDYSDTNEDDSEDDEDDEEFPELDAASDSGQGDSDSDEEDLSEEEQILRELAEEEALEQDLAETSDSSVSDYDPEDPDALDHAVRRATSKPDENFQDTAKSDTARRQLANNELLGFDTRSYKDKARIGKSAVTGEERWTWDEIEPGWDSDEGAEEGENRVGKIPDYFYEGMPHVGYDIDGKKVMRPAKGDELDKFLASIDDPSSWSVAVFVRWKGWLTHFMRLQDLCRRQTSAKECTVDRCRARPGAAACQS